MKVAAVIVVLLSSLLQACGGGDAEAPLADRLSQIAAVRQEGVSLPVAVASLQKVGEVRVGRTTFDYEFRVLLRGGSVSRAAISATVVQTGEGVSAIDRSASIDYLAPGQVAAASDTITLRVDRTRPFVPESVRWQITSSAPKVATLELSPKTFLLVPDTPQKLTVVARDAHSYVVADAAIVYASSNAPAIKVDAVGSVRAALSTGSALVSASADGVTSAPSIAIAAEPVAGAVLVSDAQVTTGPTPLGPVTAIGVGTRYTVMLSDVRPLKKGDNLISSGESALAGRVVDSTQTAAGQLVTVEVVPLNTLFKAISVNLHFTEDQLSAVTLPADTGRAKAQQVRPLASANPCKFDPGATPVTVQSELKIKPKLSFADVVFTTEALETKDWKVVVHAQFQVSGKVVVGVGAAVSIGVSCQEQFWTVPIPVSGPLSVVVGPSIPISLKLSGTATLSSNLFSIEIQPDIVAKGSFGVMHDKVSHELVAVNDIAVVPGEFKHELKWLPSASPRLKANFFVGAATGLDFGIKGILSLKLVDLSAGPELEAKLGFPHDVATDPIFDSGYKLKATVVAKAGSDVKEIMKLVFGTEKAFDPSARFDVDIATSPKLNKATANRSNYVAGDRLVFKVVLKPEAVKFLGIYNVHEIRVYKLDTSPGGTAAKNIAAIVPLSDQTSVELEWTADDSGAVTDQSTGQPKFFAFVVPRIQQTITELFPLPLGGLTPEDAGWDAADDFWTNSPKNKDWKYGWDFLPGGIKPLYQVVTEQGIIRLIDPGHQLLGAPSIGRPQGSKPVVVYPSVSSDANQTYLPTELVLHPSVECRNSCLPIYAKLRFTAPTTGMYKLRATFSNRDSDGATTEVLVIVHRATQQSLLLLEWSPISPASPVVVVPPSRFAMEKGDYVDFIVAPGPYSSIDNVNDMLSDSTGLSAQIQLDP